MADPSRLTCKRDLFDIPRDVCFLNAGSWSPLPKSTIALAKDAIERKVHPWRIDPTLQADQNATTRATAAHMVGADAKDIAIMPSISYGVATAAKILNLPPGSRVIVLADDHSSPVLEWTALPEGQEMSVRTVYSDGNGNWTDALLAAIEEEAAKGLALVSVSNVHWADGALIDMDAVSTATRKHGSCLLIDATHAVGVIDMDVKRLKPDFMLFPTYKWLLGPYGRAFMYIDPKWHDAVPLEQTMSGRMRVRAEDPVYFTDLTYQADASRYDMGEIDFLISLDMARHGMELIQSWGHAAVRAYLNFLTDRIASGLEQSELNISLLPRENRSPHILCLGFPNGMPTGLPADLKAHNIHVAPRLGKLRISPHVYNDEEDIDRFVATLTDLMKGSA